jgi:phosphatidylglycerophosphatase A
MAGRARRIAVGEFLRHPVHWLALGFGSGLAPRAPGTFGTLVALPLHLLLLSLPWGAHGAAVLLACIGGVWICGESARRLGVHDHPAIVWDEIAAFLLLLWVLPLQSPGWWLAAFALFRLFDIWKPWPIRDLDHRLHGGTGIMLDDIVAALFAWVLLLASTLILN